MEVLSGSLDQIIKMNDWNDQCRDYLRKLTDKDIIENKLINLFLRRCCEKIGNSEEKLCRQCCRQIVYIILLQKIFIIFSK